MTGAGQSDNRRLSNQQKAAIADCSCILSEGMQHPRLAKKKIVIPFVAFALALWLFWALWPPALWWLLGIYGVLVVGTFAYRIVRGHSLRCAIKWSPIAALYTVADALMTAISI